MRLKVTKSSKSTRLYAIKSTYDPKTKKTSSKIAAKLGTAEEVMEREGLDFDGAIAWARAEIARMTKDEALDAAAATVRLRPAKRIEKGARRRANAGYLFPAKVLSELGLKDICGRIAEGQGFDFDLGEIAEHLVTGRMLAPSSKLATFKWCQKLVEPPAFAEHQIYRALSVLAEHADAIQAGLYKSSTKLHRRRTGVLYYDCTNYFFEIEGADEDGDRRYGVSKEHRPNPIVQMGLFMDADGIPLAFRITPGNTSEQTTLKPLERTIVKEFGESRFVVCTDAGLSSKDNRLFNTQGGRAFVTVQSIKKMKTEMREWALDPAGWKLSGSDVAYDLRKVGEVEMWERVFYKERWAKDDDGFEQRYVAAFSFKYMEYQASIREQQAERAGAKAAKGAKAVERRSPNDPARFLSVEHVTAQGELADRAVVSLDESKIAEEARYDGFSCIATSLEDDPADIIAINKRRWQIEECFRIMKTEFKARPVYLSRADRIRGHFLTCFIALLVYRLMDERLGHEFTCEELLSTLRGMDMLELSGEGWVPAYTRDDVTDALHDVFGFRTDYEIVTNRQMGKVLTAAHSTKVKGTKR
ncbi:IS1634 family transposase [Eggerthellaceae bacterium zg-887]|uniref:IS1634 family transposase n=1 Tax=Xiamenia xianingshaonis TaxID=2682776 RepID=UPI00140E667B|nr:IS1634 family transposase [Xiamenia xianingshaonis]NHM17062.1 IS1634 family transposase [Xiamenia xianingshaonis]